MGLLLDIKSFFIEKKSSESISLLDTASWGARYDFLGVNRTPRIRYDNDSAFTAYRSHELVYACVNKIADVMNDAEIVVEAKNSKGEWVKKDGHLLPALFKRPNDHQTGRDARKLMVQSEQSLGRFYAHIERSAAGIPVQMTVLNPSRVAPIYDRARTQIIGYEYTKANGTKVPLKIEDLLIRRRPDLLDQFGGFAPLSAALKSINSDLGLTDYVDAFFESDGTPSGILKILNENVSNTKREALQAQWKRKYSRGGSNQKGLAVLDQNADYQKIGSNLDELESDSLSGRFESRICSVFGVPPNLVGAYVGLLHVTANATAKAELQNFWENKISGELSVLREWLTWFVLPEFEALEAIRSENVRVGWDISHVAFLQEDVEKIHDRARKNLQAGGCTLNEFRQAVGLTPDPKGDYYLQPMSLEARSPENRAIEAFEKVPAGTDPTKEPAALPDPAKSADPLEKKTFDLDGLTLGREPRGVETVIDLKKIVDDFQSQKENCVKILSKFRLDLINQAATKLDSLDVAQAHSLTLVPDAKRRKEIAKALKSAFQAGREQIIDELNHQNAAKNSSISLEIKAEDPHFLEYLDELTDGMISRIIAEITLRAVNEYLSLKLLLDYTIEKLLEALTGQSEKFIDQIAGNSVNAAISSGRDEEIKDQADNIEYVEYSAILDKNTCGPCEDADGETATDPLDLPAAPNPDCEGGGNCRCIHVAVAV